MTDTQKPLTLAEEQLVSDGIDKALADPLPENPEPEDLIFLTSSGAKIRPEVTDENLIQKIFTQFPEPDPPIVMIRQGTKEYPEENRQDPTFIEQMLRANAMRGEAMLKLYLLRSVTILELPEGVEDFADDPGAPWVEEYEAIGFVMPPTRTARRLEWSRFVLFPRASDLSKLQKRSHLLSGVTEEDIAEELKRFPNPGGSDTADSVA